MKARTLSGTAMATLVAGMFAMTAMNATAADHAAGHKATVKCMNSSSCKGQGACKQASNSCKGQNACKGQGLTMQKTQADCEAAQAANKAS